MPENKTKQRLQAAMTGLEEIFPGCALVLMVTPFDKPKGINYVSNGTRESVQAALRELLARWEGRAHAAPAVMQ